MPIERLTEQPDEQFSFRRLIRYGIALQVIVIALLLGITLWGSLKTRSASENLTRDSRNVLLLTGADQEFDRARIALRQYAASGRTFSFGAFNQSLSQITTIGLVLQAGLPKNVALQAQKVVDLQFAYLQGKGSEVVRLVRAGKLDEAKKVLSSREALADLEAANEANAKFGRLLAIRQSQADDAVSRRQTINSVLIVLSGLLILGTGISLLLWIRRETMVPLEKLAIASRKLGHGDLSARVEPGGVSEVALTGLAFNQMADEIERHVGQLHELSVARSRFVSSVSHELRTPITSLRGYLELLANGEAGELEADQMRFVEIADRNARQLSDLIDDLLTLSRVQGGRMNVRRERINLRELLHDLKSEMLPISSERKVDIVLVDTGDLIIEGDPLRLRQAFGNLLSNAIKYSRDGQAVVVRALAADRQAVVSFVDWGLGIPRDDLPQIAEPFFRSDANEGVPGTGLGLAIAKQMIELHGGRLAAESELGSGSTFTVYLPLELDDRLSGVAEPEDDEPESTESATTTG